MEWKRVRLGDYISIKSGLAYKGSKIGKGNSILLGMGCVSFKDKFVESGARSYEEDDCDERFLVKPGDIVLATRQQSNNLPILAMPAIVPNSFEDTRVIFGTNLYKVENHSEISSKFLFWLMKHQHYVNYIASVKSGTAVQMVTKKNVEDYKFMCPPIEVRNRISEILWTYDSLIENNTKRIRLLEKMAENLYKEWFVRFRFPGYEKAEMENELPKGWKVERYGEVAAIYAGGDKPKVYSKEISTECNIPIYSNGVENNGLYGFTNKATVKVSSITISARGTVGFVAIRRIPFVPIVRLLTVVPQKGLDVYYLYFASRNNDLEGNGTSQQQLTVPMLKKRKVVIPIKELLREFGNRCSLFYNQIDNLQHQNSLLARRRDLLLPRLMSGKLEVKP